MRDRMRKGASTIICYLATMWLAVLGMIFFLENFNLYSKVGKTQLYADLIADGSCFLADNGWGLKKSVAHNAKNKLKSANSEEFKYTEIKLEKGRLGVEKTGFDLFTTDNKGNPTSDKDHGNSSDNTIATNAGMHSTMVTSSDAIQAKNRDAWTKINYSGGLRIVREAWTHTYEHKYIQHLGGKQTEYVWGGGHTDLTLDCLNSGADCSGFVTAVFRKFGFSRIVGNSCTGTLENCGRLIGGYEALDRARPGDIILYWWNGGGAGESDHVVIYAGKYKGQHWVVECHGGNPAKHPGMFIYDNPGKGPVYGAHINPMRHPQKIMIRRIVDSDGKAEKLKKEDARIGTLSRLESLIARRYLGLGFSKAAVAGILGNWFIESGVTTYAREGLAVSLSSPRVNFFDRQLKNKQIPEDLFANYGKPGYGEDRGFTWPDTGEPRPEGYGLGQWTSEDRRRGLYQAAEKMGSTPADEYVQMAFAYKEMCNGVGGFSVKSYMNSTDPSAAAATFLAEFEGIPNHSSKPKRQARALIVYANLALFA